MCRGKSCKEIVLNINGVDCSDSALISNHFINYFSYISNEINNDISLSKVSPLDYMGSSLPVSFLSLPVTEDVVRSVISSFVTKGCNLDDIPVYIYKYLIPVLCPVIANLFNCSISEGIFPDCLKVGRVIPLHKAGDTMACANHRPITTLPVSSNILRNSCTRECLPLLINLN